ncbi:MAG: hypothetical protein JO257_33220 [Deltaproteobacteria bacterium]|nr:hypothetical protein [Deltaproteobacteria bacterium]
MVARGGLTAVITKTADPQHEPLARLDHDGKVMDVEWSAHGDFLVSASIDGKVRVWDRAGHLLVALGDGHSAWWRARFSPDDRYIISASANGVQIWELPRFGGSYEQLVRCRQYDLDGTQLRPARRPPDCT